MVVKDAEIDNFDCLYMVDISVLGCLGCLGWAE